MASDNRELMALLLGDDLLAARVLATIGAAGHPLAPNAVVAAVGADFDRVAVILAELNRLGALVIQDKGFLVGGRMLPAVERLSQVIGNDRA